MVIKKEIQLQLQQLEQQVLLLGKGKQKLELFLNGVQLTRELGDGVYRIYNNNKFIGLGIINDNLLKRDVVI